MNLQIIRKEKNINHKYNFEKNISLRQINILLSIKLTTMN